MEKRMTVDDSNRSDLSKVKQMGNVTTDEGSSPIQPKVGYNENN